MCSTGMPAVFVTLSPCLLLEGGVTPVRTSTWVPLLPPPFPALPSLQPGPKEGIPHSLPGPEEGTHPSASLDQEREGYAAAGRPLAVTQKDCLFSHTVLNIL